MSDKTTRPYRSQVRANKAARTKARITQAARDLFMAGGFAETSVAQVARAAETTPQTVHAHFGSKGGLLAAILKQMEESAEAEHWRLAVTEAKDGSARLEAWAGWTVSLLSPSGRLMGMAVEAATDPAMRELKTLGDQHRRAGATALGTTMAQRGELRPGLDASGAADTLYILSSLEVYLSATSCGWTAERVTAWLADALKRQLLP